MVGMGIEDEISYPVVNSLSTAAGQYPVGLS